MSQVIEKYQSTKERVRSILHKYPSARNSTRMCYLLFLKHHSPVGVNIPFIPKEEVEKVIPHPDSIARAMRQIQNTEKDPKAQPNSKIKSMRQEAEEIFTAYFAENKNNEV